MKIPNLAGRDYSTILETVKGVVNVSRKNDKEAKENGELIKYVVETFGKDGLIDEVKQIYSDKYCFNYEIVKDLNISKKKYNIRGPFSLFDGALADSKLNRWEKEKEQCKKDEMTCNNLFQEAKEKNYKYGYAVYENIMGIDRFVELRFSCKALPKYKIDKILKSTSTGNSRIIKRIRLSDREVKAYK